MKCEICGKEYKDDGNFGQHMKRTHGISLLEYRVRYEGFVVPSCPYCGKPCVLHGKTITTTCGSRECAQKARNATNLERYGSTCSSKNPDVKEKARRTNLARYGVEWTNQDPATREKQRKTCLERFGTTCNLAAEENKEKVKATNLKKYGVENPMQSAEIQERVKQTNLKRRGVEYTWLSEDVRAKSRATNLERRGVENAFQDPEVQQKARQTIFKKYGADHQSKLTWVKEKIKETNLKRYGVPCISQNPEVHVKQMARKRKRNGGYDSTTEKKLAEMFANRDVEFETHHHVNGHEFDFALFKDGELKCLVDVDGEYNHGLLSDVDGKHVRGEKDCERFGKVPEGVNFVVVDSLRVTEENVAEILKPLEIDYEAFISGMIESLPAEFPYPTYDEERMRKDWRRLCEYDCKPGQRIGYSIIDNFHKSIWSAHVGNKPSPVEAWSNPELLEKCVRNRFIYKSVLSSRNIADGFNVCKLAPKVSVFNPSLARRLLRKYAPSAKTVLDPFSGFSGRMLGACSLGMKYSGFDASSVAVEESNKIIEFLGLEATVERKDVLENSGSADVLFTCSPYGKKESWSGERECRSCEEWIDVCLERFKCGRYVFVVDDPGKYSDLVVETVENKSHFSAAKEMVVVVEC